MASTLLHCLFLAMLVFCLNGLLQATARSLNHELAMVEMHEQWMAQHNRVYKDDAVKQFRFKIFKENVELIRSFNDAGRKPYKLGINAFTDMTNEEFRSFQNGYEPSGRKKTSISFKYENATAVPASMDWRTKGAVTPIEDQNQCGSCWAFSAVAATEGIIKITTGKLIPLSEQELIDCDTNKGCSGGDIDSAFEFIKQHGLASEANYPYAAADEACNQTKEASPAARISGYEDVPPNNENALLKTVANQPVSVAIDASGFEFQFYSGGVFSGPCGTTLDHGVAAIGYGAESDGTKYWLVKNSWGTSWGEKGYIRMQRDVQAKEGLCGIAMEASYPIA